jgi:hypothetical protein
MDGRLAALTNDFPVFPLEEGCGLTQASHYTSVAYSIYTNTTLAIGLFQHCLLAFFSTTLTADKNTFM